MSKFLEYFNRWSGRQIDKWEHYFPIYERHFEKYRFQSPRVLEIGIDHGGSLQMWKSYFGDGAEIIGVDCKSYTLFDEPQITTYTFDQQDPALAALGPFDIVIDDGSHETNHQTISFENLWPRCQGVYLIEDCHNSYPILRPSPQLVYRYPWVIVAERPKRLIRGEPTRELRADEAEARKLYGPR